MNQEIALFKNFGLATPSSIAYSESMNAFIGNGYTSLAGNTSFNAVRFADGLLIKEDVCDGHTWRFLNSLHIYDLKTHKLLAEKVYPLYQGVFRSENLVRSLATSLLSSLIVEAALQQGIRIDEKEVSNRVRAIIDKSFASNQIQELEKNVKALGF